MAATIYEVARAAGVSTATVSRALRNDERISARTRESVAQIAAQLHYVPRHAARALTETKNHTLGLVLPHIDGPYYADLVVGFETAASAEGYSVIIRLAQPGADATALVRKLSGQVDGMAFLARSAATNELVAETSRRMPVVTAARERVPGSEAFYVRNRAMAEQLTQHLLDLGRRRIAFVGLTEPGSDLGLRAEGHARAMTAAGLQTVSYPVFPAEDDGIAFAHRFVADRLPHDALVCGNDELALAVMHTLQRQGVRVPDDLAITGWDDTVAARYVSPGLTTVSQPVRQLGGLVAQRLAQRIAGGDHVDEVTTLPATLAHRTSCGCHEAMSPAGSPAQSHRTEEFA